MAFRAAVFTFLTLTLSVQAAVNSSSTVLGYSGLLLVPTAQTAGEGDLRFGVCRIPKLYARNYRPYDRTVFFVDLGYFSFLEATFAIVRPDHFPGGVGDRSAAIRIRLVNETSSTPALAIGLHDFFAVDVLDLEPVRAQHFAASYIAASKHFQLSSHATVGLHIGYGNELLPANDRLLNGWFGGLAFSPLEPVELLLEYDAHRLNAGCRFSWFSRLDYTFSFWQLRYPMHHLSLRIPLLGDDRR